MKDLPPELKEQAREIAAKYEREKWSHVEIRLPDYSDYQEPSIFVHATSPSGERVHCIILPSANSLKKIQDFLDEKAQAG